MVIPPKEPDGMANSVDPDQTTAPGAVLSGTTLFAQTCLSKNIGSLIGRIPNGVFSTFATYNMLRKNKYIGR